VGDLITSSLHHPFDASLSSFTVFLVEARFVQDPTAELADAHLLDYSIHYFDKLDLLIAHMRYIGPEDEFESTMEKVKDDEPTRRWWKVSFMTIECPSFPWAIHPVAKSIG
jgi:L-rhamnose mutarotase